jgi:hypothetical protein
MLSEIRRQRELAIGIVGFRSLDLAIPDRLVYGDSRLLEVDVLGPQAKEFVGAKSCLGRQPVESSFRLRGCIDDPLDFFFGEEEALGAV